MDFITINFETANSERSSPCKIELTIVENDEIVNFQYCLIKPKFNYFEPFNTMMHGIAEEDVENESEFPAIWEVIKPLIENKFVIFHNAGFHMSVLRHTLELYSIPFPNFQYSCSSIFSKHTWQGIPSYDIETLCSILDIDFINRRDNPVSAAIAEVALIAFAISDVNTIDDFPSKLKTTIGYLSSDGSYKPAKTQKTYHPRKEIVGNPKKHNPNSIFYGRNVVFTGTLQSMVRSEALKIVADIGGFIGSGGITKETDFLIVGQQDFRVVGSDGMSGKQEKAVKLVSKGLEIEILSEEDFLKHL